MVSTRSSPGTAENSGAAARPTATVTLAPGWRSSRWPSKPVDSTASPIRVAVMNSRRMAAGYKTWSMALPRRPVIAKFSARDRILREIVGS